jgi:hypothetical protein
MERKAEKLGLRRRSTVVAELERWEVFAEIEPNRKVGELAKARWFSRSRNREPSGLAEN